MKTRATSTLLALWALAGCSPEDGQAEQTELMAESAPLVRLHCPAGEAPHCDERRRCTCVPIFPPEPTGDPCLSDPPTLTISALGPVDEVLSDLSWARTACGRLVVDIIDAAAPYTGRVVFSSDPALSVMDTPTTDCTEGSFSEIVYAANPDATWQLASGWGGTPGTTCLVASEGGVRKIVAEGWSVLLPLTVMGGIPSNHLRIVLGPFWFGAPIPIRVTM